MSTSTRYSEAKDRHAAAVTQYHLAITHGTTADMERALDAVDAAHVALSNAARARLGALQHAVMSYVARAA